MWACGRCNRSPGGGDGRPRRDSRWRSGRGGICCRTRPPAAIDRRRMSDPFPVLPNLFVVGAPKSGTTAMCQYLSEHPGVFLSNPKEPFYFDTDHPMSKAKHQMHTLSDYARLYRDADPTRHRAVGEGSTTYLQSRVAIENLMRFNPAANVVAMIRNPIEVAHGMHGEHRRHFIEDVEDFAEAWELQETRAAGNRLPENRRMESQLQYRDVGAFGDQLERMFEHVPESQRLVIVFDDFKADAGAAYRSVLELCGVEDDGRTDFPKVHQARVYRSERLGRFYNDPPPMLRSITRRATHWLKGPGRPVRNVLDTLFSSKQPRTAIDPELRRRMADDFRPQVEKASELLERDLSHWTAGTSAAVAG